MAKQSGFKYDLGDLVKDKVTGFQGVIIVRTEWLNGCRRYSVQSQELKDGKPMDAVGFDEDGIELVEANKVGDKLTKDTGGGTPEPKRAPDPSR
jgi:hypothetical protein